MAPEDLASSGALCYDGGMDQTTAKDAKEVKIKAIGLVIERCRDGMFRVQVIRNDDKEHVVLARLAGKLRNVPIGKKKTGPVSVFVGDKVEIDISPYDLTRGIISRRERIETHEGEVF